MGHEARQQAIGWVPCEWRPIWRVQIRRPAPLTPLTVPVLIDTGACVTLFDPSVFEKLGVSPTGKRMGAVLGGQHVAMCDAYVLDLELDMTVSGQPYLLCPQLTVYAQPAFRDDQLASFPGQATFTPHDGLLGMNVLRDLRVTFDRRRFKIECPAR